MAENALFSSYISTYKREKLNTAYFTEGSIVYTVYCVIQFSSSTWLLFNFMICNMIILKAYEDHEEQVGRAGHQTGKLIHYKTSYNDTSSLLSNYSIRWVWQH